MIDRLFNLMAIEECDCLIGFVNKVVEELGIDQLKM